MFEFLHFDIKSTAQTSHCVGLGVRGVWWRDRWMCEYVEEGGRRQGERRREETFLKKRYSKLGIWGGKHLKRQKYAKTKI